MIRIEYYYLYYTPKGGGQVVFKLTGEANTRNTGPISATELTALATVLSQKRISYDPTNNVFASFDDDIHSPLELA